MPDILPDFETVDNQGSTVAFDGTATGTATSIPAVADKVISGFMFEIVGAGGQLSADGGATFYKLPEDALGYKNVKGNVTQIQIKSSDGDIEYRIWVDFENE